MKKSLIAATMALTFFGGIGMVNYVQPIPVLARKKAKVIKKYDNKQYSVHLTKGWVYKNEGLTKKAFAAGRYRNIKFNVPFVYKIKQANDKTGIYYYIVDEKNARLNGYVWAGNTNHKKLIKDKVPKGKHPYDWHGTGTSKQWWYHLNQQRDATNHLKPDKNGVRRIPWTNIRITTKVMPVHQYHLVQVFYAKMTNRHIVFTDPWGTGRKHSLEQMPGIITSEQATNLTNDSGHWRLYYINGIDDSGIFKGIAPNISGYKNLLDSDDESHGGFRPFPSTFGDVYDSNDAAYLVSYSKKVLLLSKQAQKISDAYWAKND
ncbi:hypothetical protein [Lentilactobacillus otakiensis]|uniref:hypothetical protein n=1 Tax=Lentilactobacillus otakiensis TaxID=481720 RepID=UPI003D16E09F